MNLELIATLHHAQNANSSRVIAALHRNGSRSCRRRALRHAQGVVRDRAQRRVQCHPYLAHKACLSPTSVGFQPAETRFDAFSLHLARLVTRRSDSARIQPQRIPAVAPCDARSDASMRREYRRTFLPEIQPAPASLVSSRDLSLVQRAVARIGDVCIELLIHRRASANLYLQGVYS